MGVMPAGRHTSRCGERNGHPCSAAVPHAARSGCGMCKCCYAVCAHRKPSCRWHHCSTRTGRPLMPAPAHRRRARCRRQASCANARPGAKGQHRRLTAAPPPAQPTPALLLPTPEKRCTSERAKFCLLTFHQLVTASCAAQQRPRVSAMRAATRPPRRGASSRRASATGFTSRPSAVAEPSLGTMRTFAYGSDAASARTTTSPCAGQASQRTVRVAQQGAAGPAVHDADRWWAAGASAGVPRRPRSQAGY